MFYERERIDKRRKESREFMAGVWNKVRYYEYCRAEEEKSGGMKRLFSFIG